MVWERPIIAAAMDLLTKAGFNSHRPRSRVMAFSCKLVSFSNFKYVLSSSGSLEAALHSSSQNFRIYQAEHSYMCCHIIPRSVAGIPLAIAFASSSGRSAAKP